MQKSNVDWVLANQGKAERSAADDIQKSKPTYAPHSTDGKKIPHAEASF